MHADTRQFLRERKPGDKASVRARDLYEAYAVWAVKHGIEPRTNAAFGTDIGIYFTRIRRTDGHRYLEHELDAFAANSAEKM